MAELAKAAKLAQHGPDTPAALPDDVVAFLDLQRAQVSEKKKQEKMGKEKKQFISRAHITVSP